MKKTITILCAMIIFIIAESATAQTNKFPSTGAAGIGTTAPNASSLLEIKSTTKGLLIPRMTLTQRNAIASPAKGLLIYQTDNSAGFYYYTGNAWNAILSPLTWQKNGTSVYYNAGKVGIGTNAPAYKLDVAGDVNISSGSVFRINGKQTLYDDAPNQNMFVGDNAGIALNGGYNNTGVGPLSLNKNTNGNYNTALGANSLAANTSGASNTAVGEKSLYKNTTGYYNIALGSGALYTNATASNNVAIGYQSLYSNNSGNNTAIGFQSLYKNTAGDNVSVGYLAAYSNTTGSANIAIGSQSLHANTTGGGNMALGYQALYSNTTGGANIGIGNGALNANTTGFFNVAIGTAALSHNNAIGNTAVGAYALNLNTTGIQNAAFGYNALVSNTGSYNTAAGYTSLQNNTTGAYNTALGSTALSGNTTGSSNTAVGEKAMQSNTTGGSNTALGSGALQTCTTSNYNTAVGFQSLYNVTYDFVDDNTGVGYKSLFSNGAGSDNTGLGFEAGYNNTAGSQNIFIGSQAGIANTGGGYNVYMGYEAGKANTDGSFNVYIGTGAGQHITTSDFNTLIGYAAGGPVTGQGNTFIGYASGVNSQASGAQNSGSFGYDAIATAANQIFMGNPTVSAIEAIGDFLSVSDGRFKKNIKANVSGLDFINKLRPVTYTLDVHGLDNKLGIKEDNILKEAADKKEKTVVSGFIAQEVEQAAKDVNYNFGGVHDPENDGDLYALSYPKLVVPLVKAVQELSKQNDSLKEENASLQSQMNDMRAAIQMLANKEGVNISASVSSASLQQNVPNPYNHTTSIAYNLPAQFSSAQIVVTDITGKTLKTVNVSGQGKGVLHLDASTLASGTYNYSLYVDGKLIGTKKMLLSK